ncbi:class I SAM-dependent methyltransferase [Methyloferula stellata]|uniref:class I SAM-dependent methyltransferase n=1 Tax=Methyloferula stellata TaxID=876270 RepID=UPI000369DC3E|nr:class I SAM-dependent methyltransferase [Methyloferula stellata]
MRWSETVKDYYDVRPAPRWGHGKPTHPELTKLLNERRHIYSDILDDMLNIKPVLHAIPMSGDEKNSEIPYWSNTWFSNLDATSLVYFLSRKKPRRYLEIGSGYCTMFARHTIKEQRLDTTIISVDPKPRANIDRLCDRVIRKPLEECDVQIFDELDEGDILFFDGSHRVFENSDVTVFFLEVLPRLKKGVFVHIHDIFLPSDYVATWNERLYSEQYMLAAMLLCKTPPFQVLLPNFFICTDSELVEKVDAVLDSSKGKIPLTYNNAARIPGVSFWLETV